MTEHVRAIALALALAASAGFATAQTTPSATGAAPGQLNLTPSQEQALTQKLGRDQPQRPPAGYQPQVGSKLPDAVTTTPLPQDLALQIPQLGTYHYTIMPGHMLVVDPKTQTVMELISIPDTTTGSAPAR